MAVTFSGKDKILKHARIYVGGYDLSGDARTIGGMKNSFEEVDVTGWSNDLAQRGLGLRDVGIDGFQSIMNPAAGQAHAVMKNANWDAEVTVAFGGGGAPAIGDPTYHLIGHQLNAGVAVTGGVAAITGSFIPQAGAGGDWGRPLGRLHQPNASVAATFDASSVDWGDLDANGATVNGGSAVLHVLSSTTGDFEFRIEDSDNDADWATLLTFDGDGSAVGSEYKTTTDTVDRYTRFSCTRTAGTVFVVVSFAIETVFLDV